MSNRPSNGTRDVPPAGALPGRSEHLAQDRPGPGPGPEGAGGWRYYAHLIVLARGFEAETTITRRASAPRDRVGGVDGNVSNLAVVSMPADPATDGVILADYVC